MFEAAFELLVPVVVAKIVDVGLGAPLAGGGYDANTAYIVKMSMLLIGLGLVGLGCAVVAQYFAAKAATGVSYELRRALFAKLQSLSYSDYDEIGTSAMLNRMTGDVQQFQTGINMFLRLFLRSPLIVFGAMIAAFFIDPPSAWVFAAVIPALFLAVALIMGITTPLYRKAQEKSDKVVLAARENLSGVRVVRAFCKEEEERAAFRAKNRALTKGREKAGAIGALMNPVTFVLVNLAVIFLLKIGAIRVDNGSLSQGGVIALYNLMSQILVELVKFANLVVTVTKAAACGERIEGVLEKKSSLKTEDENGEKSKTDKPGYIVFDNATLKYTADAAPALKNVSFGVEKGETIGIIGGTGSGKSSLVSLIPHFTTYLRAVCIWKERTWRRMTRKNCGKNRRSAAESRTFQGHREKQSRLGESRGGDGRRACLGCPRNGAGRRRGERERRAGRGSGTGRRKFIRRAETAAYRGASLD